MNSTAPITDSTINTRAPSAVPSGDKTHLAQFQKASHVKEMTQDGFTMVNRSQTYAVTVAHKYIATAAHKVHPTAQQVSGETKDITTKPVTTKGVLTTAIDNQWVIGTNVTLPGQETER
jgi:hypothetical protein